MSTRRMDMVLDKTRRIKWKFTSMEQVNIVANALLRFIMVNERCKRWTKVAEGYQKLLWVIDESHFPSECVPPSMYHILKYELHFHLGLALQRLDQHKESVYHYSQAIKAVSIPKGGCCAGCVSNSCMMTPLFSRRAFAYVMTGKPDKALRDAESAVVLDNKNPDVYCIRALVRSSRNEENLAVKDLNIALGLSPNHLASKVVRAILLRPLMEKLKDETESYFTVDTFYHPCVQDFYDRLLFTLLVPHTITTINMAPDKPTVKEIEKKVKNQRSSGKEKVNSSAIMSSKLESRENFRCGTPAPADNVLAARRRKDYGEAIRRYNSKPKTAAEFILLLEKQRRFEKMNQVNRAATHTEKLTKTVSTKAFVFVTPQNYTIPVFQQINLKEAPRMYQRPWDGDKLPVADVPRPKSSPPFY